MYSLLLLVGIVLFRGIITSTSSPIVSIPNERGITSSKSNSSDEFPDKILACIDAPMATTLSGFILNNGGFSKKLSII